MSDDNRGGEPSWRNVPGDMAPISVANAGTDVDTQAYTDTDDDRSPHRDRRTGAESMNDRTFDETITGIAEFLEDHDDDADYEALSSSQKANYQEALVFLSRLRSSFEN